MDVRTAVVDRKHVRQQGIGELLGPVSLISAQRLTNLFNVMDSAYCSLEIQEHCRSLGHVPLIERNRRGGDKEPFEPADARRHSVRAGAERTNARLKDEFGGRHVRVAGWVLAALPVRYSSLVCVWVSGQVSPTVLACLKVAD